MDYAYLALTMANMAALPVRLYRGKTLAGTYGSASFQPDPVLRELDKIFRGTGSVSYYITPEFLVYGLFRVRDCDVSMVLGPVSQTPLDAPSAWRILASLGEHASRTQELLSYLSQIPAYPLQNFLQILCSIAYAVNAEKVSVAELLTEEDAPAPPPSPPQALADPEAFGKHDSRELERLLLSYIEHGQPQALEELYRQPVGGQVGYLALDALRHQKNLLVSSATLCSRAAIRGGLDRETAMSLSDQYIRRSENLASCDEVMRLNTRMTLDYARRVERLQYGGGSRSLARQARQYILSHMHRKITTEDLARSLGRSRSYLSTVFRQETGIGLNEFITQTKLDEAKRLLSATRLPLKDIADQLGFSSQSYFQNVFKKAEGITPAEYRNRQK